MRIDGRLAVFGSDDKGRRIKKVRFREGRNHLADRGIHILDFGQHSGGWSARCIRVATLHSTCNQFLPNAHRLEIHPEYYRHPSVALAQMRLAANPVQYGVHLELVIALNAVETVGPGSVDRYGGAIHARGSRDSGQRDHVGVYVGGVIIVHIAWSGGPGRTRNRRINGVFICPGRIAPCLVDHSINRVRPDEVPGIDRLASVVWIAR